MENRPRLDLAGEGKAQQLRTDPGCRAVLTVDCTSHKAVPPTSTNDFADRAVSNEAAIFWPSIVFTLTAKDVDVEAVHEGAPLRAAIDII